MRQVPGQRLTCHLLQGLDHLPAGSIKKLARELKDLQDKPEEGIKVSQLDRKSLTSCQPCARPAVASKGLPDHCS